MLRKTSAASTTVSTQGGRKGFNLSRWAINHGRFTAFLLVLLLAAGAVSFVRIGQKEDADFTFRVMVVQVLWPGATVEEMQEQVVDKIERKLQEVPGLDFVRVLEEQVGQCDALLAVIGKSWIDARDATGARRLDHPEDFVRIEIESALKQDKRVIPVLVGDTRMPRPEELPEKVSSMWALSVPVRRHCWMNMPC